MTDNQYKELVDGVTQYILSDGEDIIGVMGNSRLLSEVARTAGVYTHGLVNSWSEKSILGVLDFLTFNGIYSDMPGYEHLNKTKFEHLLSEANRMSRICQSGNINAGADSCVVYTPTGLYHGLDVHAPYGMSLCAERVALMQALSSCDVGVTHVITVNQNGKVVIPCGACLEFMEQMGLEDTWVAVEKNRWLPMRKVREYVDIYRARD